MVDAKVIFDYEAEQEDELTLAVGDIITNVEKQEGGWWEGELNGKRGVFPENFVEEIAEGDVSPTEKAAARRVRRAKVTFSYVAQQEDELSLEVGDLIDVTDQIDSGWWEGMLKGKKGVFPSNFVEATDEGEESSQQGRSSGEEMSDLSKEEEPPKVPEPEKPKMPMGLGFGMVVSPDDLKRQLKKVPIGESKKPPAEAKVSTEPLFALKPTGMQSGKRNAPGPPSARETSIGEKDAPKKAMLPPGKPGHKDAPPLPSASKPFAINKPPPPEVKKPPPPAEPKKPPPPEMKKPPPPAGNKAKPPAPIGVKPDDGGLDLLQNGFNRVGSIGNKFVPRAGSINKRPIPTPSKPPPPIAEKKNSLPLVESIGDVTSNVGTADQSRQGVDLDFIKSLDVLDNPAKTRPKGPSKNLPARYSHYRDDDAVKEEKVALKESPLTKIPMTKKPSLQSLITNDYTKPAEKVVTAAPPATTAPPAAAPPPTSPPAAAVDESTQKEVSALRKEVDELKEKLSSFEALFLKHVKVLTDDLDAERKVSAKQQIEIDRLKKQVDILMSPTS